jgi:hypothetical protein
LLTGDPIFQLLISIIVCKRKKKKSFIILLRVKSNIGLARVYRSQFLETNDVDGLNVVFPGGNLIKDVVGVDLGILNNASDLELEDFSYNWDLLGLIAPDETF